MEAVTQEIPDLKSLTLAQKAAQMVMIDIPDQRLGDSTKEHFKKFDWNGVILFAKNVENRQQVVNLVEEIHGHLGVVPLISVDQEGGLVDRFRFPDMSLSPGPMALAATGSTEATFEAHEIMGRELKSLGMHVDFAPCLDVNVNPLNPIIGVRSFGEDPKKVAEHGRAAIRGLRQGGVASTAKHFPGHGDTSSDSHIDLPTVAHARDRLEAVELLPFRAAVEEEVEMIMTAHVTFPAIDDTPGLPATLSSLTLTRLLREGMGYQGIIVTDSMAMKAVADNFGVADGAVRSVQAGADLILACGPFENQLTTVRGIVEAVEDGRLTEARLDESVARILELKRRYHFLPEKTAGYDVEGHRSTMTALVNRSITQVQDPQGLLPLQGKTLVLMPDLLPQTPLGEMERGESLAAHLMGEVEERRYHAHGSGAGLRAVIEDLDDFDQVVVAVYSRDRLPDSQKELLRMLRESTSRIVVASLSSPYLLADVPQDSAQVLSYNYTPLSMRALGQFLNGKLEALGTLPVSL